VKIYNLEEIIQNAVEKVPYYKRNYSNYLVEWEKTKRLSALPVLDHAS
jgi:phenylacetate-coenzyme A ligase PaaK-like adenylate-forming protein